MEDKKNKNIPERKIVSNKEVNKSLNNEDVIKKTKSNKSKIEEDNFSDYSKADKSSFSSINIGLVQA